MPRDFIAIAAQEEPGRLSSFEHRWDLLSPRDTPGSVAG
jgi:hypothetical protein